MMQVWVVWWDGWDCRGGFNTATQRPVEYTAVYFVDGMGVRGILVGIVAGTCLASSPDQICKLVTVLLKEEESCIGVDRVVWKRRDPVEPPSCLAWTGWILRPLCRVAALPAPADAIVRANRLAGRVNTDLPWENLGNVEGEPRRRGQFRSLVKLP